MFVLGIDAGGTKTVGLVADEQGAIVGEARGGGANLRVFGELKVEKVLHTVMEEAMGERAALPAAICLGIAGVDRDEDDRVIRAIMRRIGYKTRVLVVNDALVALVAAAGHEPGIVVIAGTGSIAYGRNANDVAARAGGWGHLLGDEGSGYWIGRHALRAVVRHADGRGQATRLTAHACGHFGITRPEQLIYQVYDQEPRQLIATFAARVQTARDEGDRVASEILDRAAGELVAAAASVVTALNMRDQAFPFVLAGGILRAVPWLAAELTHRLSGLAPRSRVQLLTVEPAVGAVRLALAEAQGGARLPAYRHA